MDAILKMDFLNLVSLNGFFRFCYGNTLRWIPRDLTDDNSRIVWVMAWCRKAITWTNVDPDLCHHTRPKFYLHLFKLWAIIMCIIQDICMSYILIYVHILYDDTLKQSLIQCYLISTGCDNVYHYMRHMQTNSSVVKINDHNMSPGNNNAISLTRSKDYG